MAPGLVAPGKATTPCGGVLLARNEAAALWPVNRSVTARRLCLERCSLLQGAIDCHPSPRFRRPTTPWLQRACAWVRTRRCSVPGQNTGAGHRCEGAQALSFGRGGAHPATMSGEIKANYQRAGYLYKLPMTK